MNIIFQIILVIVTTLAGYFILKEVFFNAAWASLGAVFGLLLGYIILKTEEKLKDVSLKIIIGSLLGITISLLVANLFIS